MSDERIEHHEMASSAFPLLHQPQTLSPSTPLSDLAIYSEVGADGKPTNNQLVYKSADLDEQLNNSAQPNRSSSDPSYIAPRYNYSSNPNRGRAGFAKVIDMWKDVELERALMAELGYTGPGSEEIIFMARWNGMMRKLGMREQSVLRRAFQQAVNAHPTTINHPPPQPKIIVHPPCIALPHPQRPSIKPLQPINSRLSAPMASGTKSSPIEIPDSPVSMPSTPMKYRTIIPKTGASKRKFSELDVKCPDMPRRIRV